MKEKTASLSYFFNFGCILIVILVNLIQAISEAIAEQAMDNDAFGKAVYYTIMINTGVNTLFGFAGIGLGIFSLILRRLTKIKDSKGSDQAKKQSS